MYRGDVDGQGTVDEDRNIGNALLVGQLMEQQHELLGAAHRERGDDERAMTEAAPAARNIQLKSLVINSVST